MMDVELKRYSERPPELAEPAAIDERESLLARLFLRR
jgi:hypothetical protein